NVPGFTGYALNAKVPSLLQILNGAPPANSPPVQVPPGAQYAYSGGGYEVVEALIADATGKSFAEVANERVFEPLRMSQAAHSAKCLLAPSWHASPRVTRATGSSCRVAGAPCRSSRRQGCGRRQKILLGCSSISVPGTMVCLVQFWRGQPSRK